MTTEMYFAGDTGLSNEELAIQVRDGDEDAAALLLSRNEGFLSTEAAKLCEQYSLPDVEDDLKQEGALALLAAAKRFDPSNGARLLTYAAGAVRSAMLDYIAQCSLPVRLPPSRYYQLRRAAYLCASAPENTADDELVRQISEREKVSAKAARSLLLDQRAFFGAAPLNEPAFAVRRYGNPLGAYEIFLRKKLVRRSLEAALTPRELNVVKYHLGLDRPGGQDMTFAELAVCLNYNGPGAAEKVFRRAIKKLREHLDAGEYGAWVAAGQAIEQAKREAQRYQGYVSPKTAWWERTDYLC